MFFSGSSAATWGNQVTQPHTSHEHRVLSFFTWDLLLFISRVQNGSACKLCVQHRWLFKFSAVFQGGCAVMCILPPNLGLSLLEFRWAFLRAPSWVCEWLLYLTMWPCNELFYCPGCHFVIARWQLEQTLSEPFQRLFFCVFFPFPFFLPCHFELL